MLGVTLTMKSVPVVETKENALDPMNSGATGVSAEVSEPMT